jgi:hypothetical protein
MPAAVGSSGDPTVEQPGGSTVPYSGDPTMPTVGDGRPTTEPTAEPTRTPAGRSPRRLGRRTVRSRAAARAETADPALVAPDASGWRELPPEVREQLAAHYPTRPMNSAHARTAVAYARDRLRRLRPALVGGALAALILGLASFLAARYHLGWRPLDRVLVVLFILEAIGTAVVAVLAAGAARTEATWLPVALSEIGDAVPEPVALRWRYSRWQRALHALGALVIAIAVLWMLWVSGGVASRVIGIGLVAVIVGREAYAWPWPIASSYPVLATLDDQGIRVHPLGLTVPWHRVSRVDVVPDLGGAGVVWRVDDPAAVAAAAPVSPAQQRRLVRWMTRNGGAIRLGGSQVAGWPEVAYLASARFRTFRVTAYPYRTT